MIPHEEFYYGLQKGSIKLYPKENVTRIKKILRPQSLEYLTNLELGRNQQSILKQNFFGTEDIIAFTHLYRSQDDYLRPCEINHTVLITVQDYLNAYPPNFSIVESLFKKDVITQNV